MRKKADTGNNSIKEIILRYGLLRDDGLRQRVHKELSLGRHITGEGRYSQTAHEVFVAVGSEYIAGRRPATSDISNLTGIPKSSARRAVSFLEKANILTQSRDPNDGRRRYIELTGPYRDIVNTFVGECAVEFADIIRLHDRREREEADRKYRSLFDNAAVGIGRLRLADKKLLLANEKLVEIFKFGSVAQYIEEFRFADLRVEDNERMSLVDYFRQHPGTIVASTYTARDRSVVYIQASGRIDRETGHCDFVVINITKRKLAEEELRRVNQDYRALFETSREGINFVGLDGKLLMCNEAYCDLVGYSMEELHSSDMHYQHLTPAIWHAMEAKIIKEKVIKEGYSGEYEKEYIRKDGTIVPIGIRAWLLTDKHGRPERMVGLVSDITERKRAEAALRESREDMARLLSLAGEAIYSIDTEGRCTFVNKACLRMLGYEREDEVLGKTMHALVHHSRPDGSPYPMSECRIYDAFRRGERIHIRNEILWRKDGSTIPVDYKSYPISKDNELTGAVVSFHGVSESDSWDHQHV